MKGRQHPVQIYYSAASQNDYVDAALRTFLQIHTDKPAGDVLIFLPGQEDIESLQKSIELYTARLPSSAQEVSSNALFNQLDADVVPEGAHMLNVCCTSSWQKLQGILTRACAHP